MLSLGLYLFLFRRQAPLRNAGDPAAVKTESTVSAGKRQVWFGIVVLGGMVLGALFVILTHDLWRVFETFGNANKTGLGMLLVGATVGALAVAIWRAYRVFIHFALFFLGVHGAPGFDLAPKSRLVARVFVGLDMG